MIIIITESNDITANIVVDWLLFYDKECNIFNTNEINTINSLLIENKKTYNFL